MTPLGSARRLLVLGGTSWLGGAVAGTARDRGLAVTCLARGSSGLVPDGVRLVRADRDRPDAYAAVAGQDWDAVVDVARQPGQVRAAVRALAGRVGHWVFVSTCSVYADDATAGADESAPVHAPWAGAGPAPMAAYGPAKVACEQAVLERFPGALVARAGLIVGHGDRSDRFGYWPQRLARGGAPVLAPPLTHPCQVVDVVDLAAWLVHCAVAGVGGVRNAVGDPRPLAEVLAACSAAASRSPELAEAGDDWLLAQSVTPWMGPESLPLWLPHPGFAGFMARSNAAARAAGLRFRPLADTVADALAWERRLGLGRQRLAGLTPGREAALLSRLAAEG